jgi:hypothetical protein
MKSTAYKVDSVDGGLRNLRDLIDVICDLRFELNTGPDDTRADSLLWIARDLSDGVVERFEHEAREGARVRGPVRLVGGESNG